MDITEQLTHESRIALAAAAEITRLRAEVEALKLERTAAELVHRETATTVLMQMAEVQRLRAAALALLNELDAGRHGAHEFNNLRNALRGE